MPQASPSVSTTASSLAPPSPFACSSKPDGSGSVWIRLGGELDLSTLSLFGETLREAQRSAGTVSIDLRGLEFIDCAGLSAIIDADALARRGGNRLILVRGSGQVDRVLKLTGLPERIAVVDVHRGEPTSK